MASHAFDSSLDTFVKRLEPDTNLAVEWFYSDNMKLNQDKSEALMFSKKVFLEISQKST